MRIRIQLITLMRIRIRIQLQLITLMLMRIRILHFNIMWINEDPDPLHLQEVKAFQSKCNQKSTVLYLYWYEINKDFEHLQVKHS
jgi:hypothetical protein